MTEITPELKPRWNDIIHDVLREFIHICKENHLVYLCCGGTAIGAIRHNGMIPWDDTTLAVIVSLIVIGFCIITSNVLRVSPFLKKWLFGR